MIQQGSFIIRQMSSPAHFIALAPADAKAGNGVSVRREYHHDPSGGC
jgi:hypothetical protein